MTPDVRRFAEISLPHCMDTFTGKDGGRLTLADKISIMVAFCGVNTDSPLLADNNTIALGFQDSRTNRLVFQTVPVQSFHESPFLLTDVSQQEVQLVSAIPLPPAVQEILHPKLFLGGTFRRLANHHFNQFDRKGNLIPATLIANPRTMCSEGCPACIRTTMQMFVPQGENYIEEHVATVARDFAQRFPDIDRQELRYVSVSTGCQSSREEEVAMFLGIMDEYKKFGFNPEFVLFSNMVRRERDMLPLADHGAVGLVSTIETINDATRKLLWGNRKGERLLIQHLRTLSRSRRIFQFAEATLVLGEDEFEELLDGVRILGDMGVTIVPNVLRSYVPLHLESVHNDAWQMGLPYLLNILEEVLKLNARGYSSAQHMRNLAMNWLGRKNPSATDTDLPYKYRGQ